MALHLCHLVPRDIYILVAFAFLFASCILQLIVVMSRVSGRDVGIIQPQHPGTSGYNAVHVSASFVLYLEGGKKICEMNDDGDKIFVGCARFVSSFYVVGWILLYSVVTSYLSFFFGMFCVVPFSKTTMTVFALEMSLFWVPLSLHSAAVGVFWDRLLPSAEKTVQLNMGQNTDLMFVQSYISILMSVSQGLLTLSFFLVVFRFFVALCRRKAVKQRAVARGDIDRLMRCHLVNDDWERQKEVLEDYAERLMFEIDIREECKQKSAETPSTSNDPTDRPTEEAHLNLIEENVSCEPVEC
ncbi:hypothetical protein, conserved [Trypanosoma brucei brucei TREU927]|uniref:Uncharacterized protein n=1 Tax=Trypanosoma brucei brucei (strain 927/4 GUTat10.1) TaxID=185431 RepID=Q38AW7_TRYB2|nr:hypothetical protein, conserved [Trypanosoma brucei brucei TREU927]EAN78053.1 hypothetical protein, conserved [Trypanosoma brucei brucei TREU927]